MNFGLQKEHKANYYHKYKSCWLFFSSYQMVTQSKIFTDAEPCVLTFFLCHFFLVVFVGVICNVKVCRRGKPHCNIAFEQVKTSKENTKIEN